MHFYPGWENDSIFRLPSSSFSSQILSLRICFPWSSQRVEEVEEGRTRDHALHMSA